MYPNSAIRKCQPDRVKENNSNEKQIGKTENRLEYFFPIIPVQTNSF